MSGLTHRRFPRSAPPFRRGGWIFLPAILAVLPFTSSCSREPAEKEPVVTVQMEKAALRTLRGSIETEAVLFPVQQAAIIPKISSPIRKFYVVRGSRVHEGEALAELENRDLAAAAQENQGMYEQAQASYNSTTAMSLPEEIQKAQADEQNARQMLDAEQKVHDSRQELFQQGALPRKDLDAATVSLTAARNQYEIASRHLDALMKIGKDQELKSAEGQLDSARGKYEGAQAQLSYSEIRSPIDGVVTDRPLYPGEMAAAGAPILTVMDTSELIAKAHVPQDAAAQMHPGDEAEISAPGHADSLMGKIALVSPALDPNSTTVEIWVKAKNPEGSWKPGTSVHLRIVTRTVEGALAVPTSAVLTGAGGGASVAVVGADGRVHLREVTVGIRDASYAQVSSGLKPGEMVVTNGAYGLPDNTLVQAAPPGPPAVKDSGKQGGPDE
jgi:HlyD family secretion protein